MYARDVTRISVGTSVVPPFSVVTSLPLLTAFVTTIVTTLVTLAAPARAFDGAFVAIPGGAFDPEAGPVEYVLEPNGSDDISDGSDLQALRDAFRAWECVEGTSLRFLERDEAGPAELNLEDDKNTLFWDETGETGMGPGTLGITLGDTGGNHRAAADIAFNGAAHDWSTDDVPSATDVGAIASHEIGHFLGLDHPCDVVGGEERNCNGPDRSVMTPAWGGELDRAPLADDEAGVKSLYPGGNDGSGCDGPFRAGEKCTCSGECIEGLVCAALEGDDDLRCTAPCASDASDCGNGFSCVLNPPVGDEPASGTCVKTPETRPNGSVCAASSECASGTCTLLFEVTRSVCQAACSSTADCEVGVCFEGFCLGGVDVVDCEEPPPECGCSTASPATAELPAPVGAGVVALVSTAWLLRRRRRGPA
jgi:uncharacterized protein (TIGR03382 family)